MGSMAHRSVLMLCGEFMEAYETIVPLYVLQAFGVSVHCVSPGRKTGDKCIMAAHDLLGLEIYTELVVDHLTLNANFDDVIPDQYDAIIIPGGRFTELLSADEKCVSLVARFAELKKLIFTSCHSQLFLAAAGLLTGGMKCTAFESMKPLIEISGGAWWQQPGVQTLFDITDCVKDGNFVSTMGWPTLGHSLKVLFESLGSKISSSKENHQPSLLFLIGDCVEDYSINVPFKAFQALGCKVDAVTPTKKRGEKCATIVHDLEDGRQLPTEKFGHNFYVTVAWDDVCVDDYDCIVVPGGRSPELLVMNPKAVELVRTFVEKGKFVAAIGMGNWLLAATGALKKRCASSYGTKVAMKVAGGEIVESERCVTDDKLITAASTSDLPAFLYALSTALGLSVVF
ncbi:unnamed protein product [Arabidopsis halleri]